MSPADAVPPALALALPALALLFWLIETGGWLWRTSHWCHYVYLADAFNHLQLHLYHHPRDAGDMAIVGERAYVVFGPLPAVPLMPLVTWLGPAAPDVLVLVLTALAATWAYARLIASVHGAADRVRLSCVTLTLALGTAIHYGAPTGNVWLHAQISATALQCWALWMAATGRPWWCGVALGLAVLTRSTVALAAPLAGFLLWRGPEGGAPRIPLRRVAVALAVPALAAGALHGAYNLARFGSVSDAGYHYILMGEAFQSLVARYGRFSLHFLPHNLFELLLAPPKLGAAGLAPDPHGMSVLLTTPYLLLLLAPRRVTRLEIVALANAVVLAAPALLYYNDGWVQFGQRFALDWMPVGLLAASFGAKRAPLWLVLLLTAVGIAVNTWGMLWFQASFLH